MGDLQALGFAPLGSTEPFIRLLTTSGAFVPFLFSLSSLYVLFSHGMFRTVGVSAAASRYFIPLGSPSFFLREIGLFPGHPLFGTGDLVLHSVQVLVIHVLLIKHLCFWHVIHLEADRHGLQIYGWFINYMKITHWKFGFWTRSPVSTDAGWHRHHGGHHHIELLSELIHNFGS